MVTNPHVLEFVSNEREERRREFERINQGQTVVRLDLYIGSPPRYPDIVATLRALATQIEAARAIGRDSNYDDNIIVAIARQHCWDTRQKLAEMHPTIKRVGVPNSAYRRK